MPKDRLVDPSADRPVVFVTGGSRGIGAATCRALARQGWDVAVGYVLDGAAAADVVDDCVGIGVEAVAIAVDVSDDDAVRRAFAAVDDIGRLVGLVNNAGLVAPKARVDEYDADRVRRLFEVNVFGAFACCREAVRRLSTAYGGRGGAIVNVSSAAARLGSPGEYVDYAASKAAIDTMTLGLAKEVATEGIRVNAVRPGLITTEIHASGGQPDRVERFREQIPMRRGGEATEVAEAIVWLLSDAASYVTGAILDVSGGR